MARTPQEIFQSHTFVFRDGEIAVQTVRYTLIP
jgi:hypothetical protein